MITINGEQIENIDVVYKTWTKNGNRYTSPKSSVIWLGDDCKLGNGCDLGDCCDLGNGCDLGDGCELGDCCKLGDGCDLGDCCRLGDNCELGNRCKLGDNCELGNYCESLYPLWFCGMRYSIGFNKAGYIASGCIIKPVEWWEENITRCAEEHDYTKEQIKEYQWRVGALVSWMKLHNLYESESEK